MPLRNTLILIALLVLTACGAKSSAPDSSAHEKAEGPMSPEVLREKSDHEILKAKYKRVELVCDLSLDTTRGGSDLGGNGSPARRVTWDLLSDFSRRRTLRMSVSKAGLNAHVLISVTDVTVHTKYQVRDAVAYYEMQFTPELKAEVFRSGQAGDESWSGKGEELSFFERLTTTLEDQKRGDFQSTITCTLHTEAKPGYEVQFKVVRGLR